MLLQRGLGRVDQFSTMAPADASPRDRRLAATTDHAVEAAISLEQLAHELNSLLDGSLRSVGLALRELEPRDEPAPAEGVTTRLRTAQEAMRRMAVLLERAMGGRAPRRVLHRSRSIGEEVPAILALVVPLAEDAGVRVAANVSRQAARLPMGAVGAIVLNGLRNAVQACLEAPQGSRRVSLDVGLAGGAGGGRLEIRVTDTGPGEKAAGHGLGLALCRQVVAQLEGALALEPRDPEPGMVLRVEVPLERLETT